ncbi:MAG: hypothetical protein WCI73_02655 [Phycisphaerae bacterium]
MWVRRAALAIAILLTLGVLAALCILAPIMHPVRRATVADFWRGAVGVDIGGGANASFGAVAERDGRFVCAFVGMDDIWTNWLPVDEAMKSWPAAQSELEKLAARQPNNSMVIGYQRWKSKSPEQQMGITGLNRAIRTAFSEKFYREYPSRLPVGDVLAEEREVAERAALKMTWYWATFCFEFLFFSGLVWWISWPVLRKSGVIGYLVHWGLAPLLYLLPSWLGYATRIGGVRETGGILYSWLDVGAPGTNTPWEVAFFTHLPLLLEPLSQHAWPDPWGPGGFAKYGWTMHGPISALLAGGCIGVLILICWGTSIFYNKWRARHRPQGFEVIMGPPK